MSVDVVKSEQSPTPQSSPRSLQRPPRKKSCASRLWDLLQPLARLWGIVSAIVLSGAGAELVVLRYDIAPIVIVGAALILILETMWVAALFVDLLCRKGDYSLSLRCWDFTRWSCGRARAPFYGCVATALLFSNLTLLATIAGGMILVLAALRAAVPFSPYATHGVHSPRAGSSLLSQHESPLPNVFYNAAQMGDDRCEEMTDMTPASLQQTEEERPVTPKPPLLEL